jgi:chromate transporter
MNSLSPAPHSDLIATGITAAACIAQFRFKLGTIPLIFACAQAGLVLSYS